MLARNPLGGSLVIFTPAPEVCMTGGKERWQSYMHSRANGTIGARKETFVIYVSVATRAEPRGEKIFYFLQILGGEKLLKFVEKCR